MQGPKPKSKRSASVLKRQKPKRGRRSLSLKERLQRLGVGAGMLLILTLGTYSYYAWRHDTGFFGGAFLGKGGDLGSTTWKVSLRLDGDTPLPGNARDEIVATALRFLGRGSKKDLTRAAQAIQQQGSYAEVHVLKLAADQVAVQVRRRTPLLCVAADRLRLVGSEGEVYGQVDAVPKGDVKVDATGGCPGPILTGVFASADNALPSLSLRSDFTLALGADEAGLMREAVSLVKLAKDRGFHVLRLEMQKYRGFAVTLSLAVHGAKEQVEASRANTEGGVAKLSETSELEVAMGRAPFLTKFDKLQGILDNLAHKNEQAARIELDYQGKAFRKLKKM